LFSDILAQRRQTLLEKPYFIIKLHVMEIGMFRDTPPAHALASSFLCIMIMLRHGREGSLQLKNENSGFVSEMLVLKATA
ncbi:MAG: hypothetical protein AB2705_22950, partial [Candidatus Thiodiazotropha sp.]